MRVGSLVELVNDNWVDPPSCGEIYPVKGVIYTIREIKDNGFIRLEEIVNRTELLLADNGRLEITEIAFYEKKFREIMPPMEICIENILDKVQV